jgi:glycosyltransferase involved in cell wall biosynthesis
MAAVPPASFIIFAYNQKRFIREAVESAFAQTYEPLEIILSDDGSSDGTLEIMQEMAAAYRGPHEVQVVRTPQNLGVTRHVLLRGSEAQGEIVIVAAGDDISEPERTARLVEAFGTDPALMAVSSGFDLVDAAGTLISAGHVTPVAHVNDKRVVNYLRGLDREYKIIQGSTASYRRSVFDLPVPTGDILFSEDNLLNFLVYVNGGYVEVLDDSLVLYRQHDAALNNRRRKVLSWDERERAGRPAAKKHANKMETFLWISQNCRRPELADRPFILRELERARLMHAWADMGLAARLASLTRMTLGGRLGPAKWQAKRLFGRFPRYQPLEWIEAAKAQVSSRP